VTGGKHALRDLGATTLAALDFDRIRLGNNYGNFGAASAPAFCHIRAFALYLSALSDVDINENLKYFRAKWAADELEH
jgi:hypothetical protein